jgi:NTE family protein
MNYPYQNLVFKGGGVKGIAYVGALKALEEANVMAQITGFAGTSAGSIVSIT